MSKERHCYTFFVVTFSLYAHASSSSWFINSPNPFSNYDDEVIYNKSWINFLLPVPAVNSTEYSSSAPIVRSPPKKWQVGRVSRKQYEIINMLWKRTNIFEDEDTTTRATLSFDNITSTETLFTDNLNEKIKDAVMTTSAKPTINPTTRSTTLSYIEFYYLDETDDLNSAVLEKNLNPKESLITSRLDNDKLDSKGPSSQVENTKVRQKFPTKFKKFVSRFPLFAFRINEPVYKRTVFNAETTKLFRNKNKKERSVENGLANNLNNSISYNSIISRYVTPNLYTLHSTTTLKTSSLYQTTGENGKSDNIEFQHTNIIPEDRVKFFEVYDSNTDDLGLINNSDIKYDEIDREERLKAEQMDHNFVDIMHKTKYKKEGSSSQNHMDRVVNLVKLDDVKTENHVNVTAAAESTTSSTIPPSYTIRSTALNGENAGIWSKYPFAAVYVYDNYQNHCDAATISSYWLIASAACLSRHPPNLSGNDRSAFVTFCDDNWWNPERITYVKYTMVHPQFHPKDTVRRNLYNIGVIQVVGSMASSCPGWAAVPIMSHQYFTQTRSIGSAVGWGLDRYDTSFEARDLPKRTLSEYKNYIYFGSCPGNSGYSTKAKLYPEAIKNIYCLSLPTYDGEENDPVHGSMLLVEGKLVAFYLQEERRQFGEQSAQYTGIWRLVPWVLSVAKDPEEMDFIFI